MGAIIIVASLGLIDIAAFRFLMDAYERVLGDAMAGDATLFARQDYVEKAWRIVDPVLKESTPVYEHEPGSRGRTRSDMVAL